MMLIIEMCGGVWQLETIQHCLSAVMRVWSFMDFILVTLNVNDDDADRTQLHRRNIKCLNWTKSEGSHISTVVLEISWVVSERRIPTII